MEVVTMAVLIKQLIECSLNDILNAWNNGFQGYDVNVSMNMKQFLSRMDIQNLSPEHSFIAFDEQKPIGIVLNGLRKTKAGKIMAWNGGTAVAPEYRHQGIGRMLIEASIAMYKKENVHVATLEALSQNKKAIQLYEKMGYQIVDELLLLEKKEVKAYCINEKLLSTYSTETNLAEELAAVHFYPDIVPWQTDFRSVKNGEVLFIYQNHSLLGYVLFKRSCNELGKVEDVTIFQCETADVEDKQDIIDFAFYVLTKNYKGANFKIINLPKSNDHFVSTLENADFHLFAKQVFMLKNME
jgi:GNAT superfamily N-acetyltransferase